VSADVGRKEIHMMRILLLITAIAACVFLTGCGGCGKKDGESWSENLHMDSTPTQRIEPA
jgi:hypothetical protein